MDLKHSLKDYLLLGGASGIVQLLGILAIPVLARLYSPSDFGVLAVFVSLSLVLTTVASFRLELAIPNEETDTFALDTFCVGALLALGFSTLILILIGMVEIVYGVEQFSGAPFYILIFLPLSVLLGSLFNNLNFLAARHGLHEATARARVAQTLAAVLAQIVLGVTTDSPLGLVIGYVAQTGMGGFFLVRGLRRAGHIPSGYPDMSESRRVFKRNEMYLKFSSLDGVFQIAALQIPILIVASAFGEAAAGTLYLALRILAIPTGVLTSAFSQIFASQAPRHHASGVLFNFYKTQLLALFSLNALCVLVLVGASDLILKLVLGDQWDGIWFVLAVLAPFVILQSTSSPLGSVFYVCKKQREIALVHLIGLLVRLISCHYAIAYVANDTAILYAFSLSGALYFFLYLCAGYLVASNSRIKSEVKT